MRLFDDTNLPIEITNYVQRTIPEGLPFIQSVVEKFISSIFGSDDIHNLGNKLSDLTDVTSEQMFLLKELDPIVSQYFEPELQQILVYSLIRKDFNLYRIFGEQFFGSKVQLRYGLDFDDGQAIEMTDDLSSSTTDMSGTKTDALDEGKAFIVYTFPYSFYGEYSSFDSVQANLEHYLRFFSVIKAARHNIVFILEPHLIWRFQDHIGIIQDQTPFEDEFSTEFLNELTIKEISDHIIPSIGSSDYSVNKTVNEEDRSITFDFTSKMVFETVNFDFNFESESPYFDTDIDDNEITDNDLISDEIPPATVVPFRGRLDPTKIRVVQYTGYVPVSIRLYF